VIATSASLAGAMLCGWLCGLTEHAFAAVRWRDSGARAAWLSGAGTIATAALIASMTLCLLTRPLAWMLVPAACLLAGWAAGRQASRALVRTHMTSTRSEPGASPPADHRHG
jgi:hypothetical protein